MAAEKNNPGRNRFQGFRKNLGRSSHRNQGRINERIPEEFNEGILGGNLVRVSETIQGRNPEEIRVNPRKKFSKKLGFILRRNLRVVLLSI